MKYTVNMSQEIFKRYIMLLGNLAEKEEAQSIKDEDIKELTCEVGPVTIYVLPCNNKTVTMEIAVKDELILDMLDVADKYTASIRKIVGSIKMLGEGMLEMTGMKKELAAIFKRYED